MAIEMAIRAAQTSRCQKSRRGAVIFNQRVALAMANGIFNQPSPWVVIGGTGCNQPVDIACDGSDTCRRLCRYNCVYAEAAALLDAAATNAVSGFDLLHVEIDRGGALIASGPPSCLPCGCRGDFYIKPESQVQP